MKSTDEIFTAEDYAAAGRDSREGEVTAEEQPRPVLRIVKWTNLWNYARAFDTDGVGSKTHLTESEGVTGKTLCGRSFPAAKGYPSTASYCKRCLNKAYAAGHAKGFTKGLLAVPSQEATGDW